MARDTAFSRYQQMREEDPDGVNAAVLLHRLTVFDGVFNASAAVAVAPSLMQDAVVYRVLTVLRAWKLIEREGKDRYSVPREVITQFPPSQEALILQLLYVIRSRTTTQQIVENWPRLREALIWSIEHVPSRVFAIFAPIADVMRTMIDAQDALDLAAQFLTAVEPSNDLYQSAFLWHLVGDLVMRLDLPQSAESAYVRALALYESHIALHPEVEAYIFYTTGRLAYGQNDYDKTRRYYEMAAERFQTERNQGSAFGVFHELIKLAFDQNNPEQTQQYLQAQLRLGVTRPNLWEPPGTLRAFANTAADKGFMEVARIAFARALRNSEPIERRQWIERERLWAFGPLGPAFDFPRAALGEIQTLWEWGQAEYSKGDRQAGCRFCLLAIVLAEENSNLTAGVVDSLRQTYDMMTCAEDSDANI